MALDRRTDDSRDSLLECRARHSTVLQRKRRKQSQVDHRSGRAATGRGADFDTDTGRLEVIEASDGRVNIRGMWGQDHWHES